MSEPDEISPAAPEQKGRYHHGDLREALIAATQQLVVERGAENFSLADACRCAGVSTAAPYRHFRDKLEILEEITARGFETLDQRSMEAVAEHGSGTLEGITAMGRAYVNFALQEQALFRLMFGQNPSLKSRETVETRGQASFDNVIGEVARYCENNCIKGDAREIAVQLWTFVHGAASLLMDRDHEQAVPEIDIGQMLCKAPRKLLAVG